MAAFSRRQIRFLGYAGVTLACGDLWLKTGGTPHLRWNGASLRYRPAVYFFVLIFVGCTNSLRGKESLCPNAAYRPQTVAAARSRSYQRSPQHAENLPGSESVSLPCGGETPPFPGLVAAKGRVRGRLMLLNSSNWSADN